jgi:hypothetical protein
MAKSRMARTLIAALLAAAPAPALAQSVDALVTTQRDSIRGVVRPRCERGPDPEEIVVCGTRDDERYRVPVQVVPGSIPARDRAGGEQLAAMAGNDQRCTPVGRDQQCNGGLDVIGIGFTIARAIVQAIANRD